MKRGISKDNIADFAHNAVSSLRRLVTSSYDSLAPFQQDLVTTSRKIEEQWQRSREPVDSGNLSLWAAALAEELRLQLSYGSSSSSGVVGVDGTAFLPPSSRKPLSESGMIASIEAARTVSCYPRSTVEELFCSYDLASLLVKYFVGGPLSKKARDVCAVALVDIAGGSLALEFVKVSLPFLVISSGSGEDGVDGVAASTITTPSKGPASSLPTAAPTPTAAAAAAAEEGAEEREPSAASATAAPVELKPINLLLATVLVSALHRADCINGESSSGRSDSYRQPLLSILKSAYVLVTASGVLGNDAGPSANAETYQVTACTIYLSLASGLLRGNNGSKLAVINGYSLEFYHVWTFAASNLMHMDLFLSVPTNVAGKDAAVALDAVLVWQSELLELLIEVCTDDSFSLRRLFMPMDIRDAGRSGVASNSSNTAHHQQQHHQQQHHHHTDGSGGGLSRYDALPSHWDTLITGGSPMLWRLGTLVSACVFHKDAVPILQGCLMGIDCSVALAESLYRCLIATLMQLCVCNPHNAKILAEASTLQCLIALVTYQQTSVFPPSVTVQLQRRDSEAPLSLDLRPVSHLSTNTTQLTESLMCTLASLYFHKDMLQLTMKAVELMAVQSACQTDADVVESLLHVLACTHNPPRVLFFPGNGSVVCKVDRFAGRWFGYSLSAWINPTCVWAEGSHLFSFTEHSGTSIAICVVANGRSCCLAVRVVTSKEMTVSIIPDSSFAAESWSHIVYTHSIAGISIYVNSRKLESSVSLPFPKEPSKRHRLDLALGGLLGEPSFFGFIASIDLLDGTLSEKEIHRLYANGPGFFVGEAHVPDAKPLISVCRGDHESSSLSTSLSSNPLFMTPVQVTGTLFDKNDGGVSVHGVLSCTSPVMLKVFKECGVMEWALKTLRKSHNALNFAVIAKLCLSFVATAMRMSRGGDAELGDVILADNYLERLKTEVLSWEDTFLDFPSVMLAAATPGGGGKTFRVHHSTQQIFSILLGRLEVVANSTSAATARNSTTLCCILRELSDGLLHAENVALFKSSPERFEQVLSLCLRLPQECIESVVVLLEKLCKAPSELEKTLRFLVLPHPQESKSSADIVKAEILRMLFDIARANVAMCDMIGGCFKGCGASFLIMLVHGMNHSSEAIRVFALRLLSLMLHVNRKFRESFAKSHGFQVLSKAIAHPHSSSSSITIRLPTLDCLFKMAFDSYQPTEKADDAITYRLSSSSSPLAKTKTNKKHRDPATMMLQTPPGGGLSGHLPGLISRRLKVTRREYSFEVAHDFARVDDRLQLDDECRNKAAVSLHAPLAIEAALRALGCLVAGIVSSSAPLPRGATCDQIGRDFLESGTDEQRLMGDAQSTASVTTPPHEDEHPERVVIRVLTYLEKVTDVPANGEALLPYPWLDWLWGAVSPLVSASRRSGNSNNNNNNNNMHHSATLSSTHLSGAGSPTTSSRYPRNFPNDVLMHTRRIIRKLVVLDMTCNRKATTLRRVRGIVQPPVLVRVILEETVRHFARGSQSELSEPTASNVVKNLDFLLRNIEFALDPFPVSLGIEIVTGISAIAVRNNSWVRMRMKNSTHLFETRDRFAGFLLSSTRSFAKVHRDLLFQLLEANASDVTAAAVLLRHLTVAVNSKKVEEVEVVLLLLRQLSSTYEDQRQELYRCCGEPCVALADLCAARDENGGSSSPTEGDADADSEGGGGAGAISRTASSRDVALPSGGRATPQVIEWSRTHEAEWSALTLSLQRMAKSEESSKAKERAEKEKNVIIKASKARHELREQMEAKVAQEFRRICSDVEAEIGVSHARVGV